MLNSAICEIVFSCCSEKETYYQQMETRYGRGYNRRLIDGKITGCGKCVGYCRYENHPGFLSKEQRKRHNCIKNNCFYYIPKSKQEKGA